MAGSLTAGQMAGLIGLQTLGSGLSGALSGVLAGHGQYRAYKYNKLLQKHQYKLQQQGYLEGPTNARQGLEAAGYNPILAVNGGLGSGFGGSASTAGVGVASGDMPDLGNSATNAYRAYKLETQGMKNQTAQTISNINLANAQAENQLEQSITEKSKRLNYEMDAMMKDAQRHSIDTKLPYEVRKLNEEIYNTMQDSELKRAMASIQSYDAETRRITAQSNATNAKTNAENARTLRANGISEHNYRQVMANLAGGRYELDRIKAPFEMTRDTLLPFATYGFASKYSTNAKQSSYPHSRYDYYYDGYSTYSH